MMDMFEARLEYLRGWFARHGSSVYEDADDWINRMSNVELLEALSWARMINMTHDQAIEAAARAIADYVRRNGIVPKYEDYARAAAPILMEQGARLALDAAAKALIGYIHPDPDSVPGRLFASAQVRDLDLAEIVKGSGDDQ